MSEFANSMKSFFIKCRRVWHTLRKPTMTELWMVTKISAIGILIVGAFGFLISIIVNNFF